MKDREITLEQRVEQAAAALVRGEDANWELARLTHESTYSNRSGPKTQPDRIPMEEWCIRVRETSGRKFATTTGAIYRRIWERFDDRYNDDQMSWTDAYWQVVGKTPEESFGGFRNQDARRLAENVERIDPEIKRELVDRLIEDPEIEQRLERTFIEKAGKRHDLAARVQREYEEQNPTPTTRRPQATGWSFIIGLGVGSEVVIALEKQREDVEQLVAYLREHGLEPDQEAAIDAIDDKLSRARELIAEYQDMIRAARGVDYETTFRRLVGGSER